jgi:hypothetical protein
LFKQRKKIEISRFSQKKHSGNEQLSATLAKIAPYKFYSCSKIQEKKDELETTAKERIQINNKKIEERFKEKHKEEFKVVEKILFNGKKD